MGILHYESKQEASKPVVSLDDQIHKLLFHSELKYVWNPGTVQKRIANFDRNVQIHKLKLRIL